MESGKFRLARLRNQLTKKNQQTLPSQKNTKQKPNNIAKQNQNQNKTSCRNIYQYVNCTDCL